jgi:hypothetical protein
MGDLRESYIVARDIGFRSNNAEFYAFMRSLGFHEKQSHGGRLPGFTEAESREAGRIRAERQLGRQMRVTR